MKSAITNIKVVGIACSAGGLNALQGILSKLPSDFPVPIVIVQHIAPDRQSLLPQILTRTSTMRIKTAEQGESIGGGTAYLAPPNRHLLIDSEEKIDLSAAEAVRFLRPCADMLFQSMAETFGKDSIAIVLSGTGTDGTQGIRAVKDAGGYVIAQDESSSAFSGMPHSAILSGMVDEVIPLASIAQHLLKLVDYKGQ
jgi:two-component system, chemotaxis family, protein-glutamate methylesterase/glutaminase